jgi:hypothetical protein
MLARGESWNLFYAYSLSSCATSFRFTLPPFFLLHLSPCLTLLQLGVYLAIVLGIQISGLLTILSLLETINQANDGLNRL